MKNYGTLTGRHTSLIASELLAALRGERTDASSIRELGQEAVLSSRTCNFATGRPCGRCALLMGVQPHFPTPRDRPERAAAGPGAARRETPAFGGRCWGRVPTSDRPRPAQAESVSTPDTPIALKFCTKRSSTGARLREWPRQRWQGWPPQSAAVQRHQQCEDAPYCSPNVRHACGSSWASWI